MRQSRIRVRIVMVTAGALAAVIAAPVTAHASEHVEWTANGWYHCGPETNGRWCTYYLYSTSCPEGAVLGTTAAECQLSMEATVWAVPVLNTGGRVVGCTTAGQHHRSNGYVGFDSTVPLYDNPEIDEIFHLDVYDVFADGKPGAAKLFATEDDQGPILTTRWIVTGDFSASCAPTGWMPTGTAIGEAIVVMA